VRARHEPAVTIVIPTRDRLDLLERCVKSLVTTTVYPHFEILLLDNDSEDPDTLHWMKSSGHRVLKCPGPFNYAAIMNRGVEHVTTPYFVTLNNDTIITQANWLTELVGAAALPRVGIVGCTQVDANGHHDHDAIAIAPYPQHVQRGANYLLEDEWIVARRDVAAVTGAVQLINRDVWEHVGGMDEQLAVVMNDVDLCLRTHTAAFDVLVLPDVHVIHHASSSRGRLDPLEDRNRFVRRWDIFGTCRDPYFPAQLRLLGRHAVFAPVTD
jgi:GT2 family glycosyltransferase